MVLVAVNVIEPRYLGTGTQVTLLYGTDTVTVA